MANRSYLILALLALGLSLPLLGYVWPLAENLNPPLTEREWQWPTVQATKEVEPQPKLLARFWPVQAPEKNTAPADAKLNAPKPASLRLVAIIKQGSQLQALVLTADGELTRLNTGDALDDDRRISAINHSSLSWQSIDKAAPTEGELSLYPRPADAASDNKQESAADEPSSSTKDINAAISPHLVERSPLTDTVANLVGVISPMYHS